MIISHKHKFIFVAIPKTATHAIRFALRPHLDEQDLEQVGLFIKKELPYPEISKLQHGHIKCKEIYPILGEDVWNNYFKFSVVRNPYDRFISYCSFMNKNNPDFAQNPSPYMYNCLLNNKIHKHILFIPQSEFICSSDNHIMIDYILKYETLQSSYNQACENIGLPKTCLKSVNTSEHKPFKEYYNDELKEMVYQFYKSDFLNFGYQKNII